MYSLLIASSPPPRSPSLNLPLRRLNSSPHFILDLMLLKLIHNIILYIRIPDSSSKDPIQNPPRSKITFRTQQQMHIRAASNATQKEAGRHNSIPRVNKGLLNGDNGQVQK